MHVTDIQVRDFEDRVELRASVAIDTHWVWGDAPFELWYRYPRQLAQFVNSTNGDAFVAALLIPSMLLGETLRIEAPVSPLLLGRARTTLQEIFHRWDPACRRIDVDAPSRTISGKSGDRDALFYSMGVDSSYSLIKAISKREEQALSHLITVEGFDVYLWESERFVPMLQSISDVANGLGMDVVAISTNLRELSDRIADWPRLYVGSALASTLLGAGAAFKTVRIASSSTYEQLYPAGSHPLTDRLWGTETTSFVHDGCEASRLEKIRLLSEDAPPVVLNSLRVCGTDEVTDAYNCGKCEKCIRTMIGLHICSALDRCDALPNAIEATDVTKLKFHSKTVRAFYREMADALKLLDGNHELEAAVRQALEQPSSNRAAGPSP